MRFKNNKYYIALFIFICFQMVSYAQLNAITTGSASDLGGNCFQVTPDQLNLAGGVWYDNSINFTNDFTIYYQNNFGNKNANGADGMALVFKPNPSAIIGGTGGGIGFAGILNSLIIEFDTYQNNEQNDLAVDHIGILSDGVADHNAITSLAGPIQASSTSGNIEDGMDHNVKIIWTASSKTLEVYFDCILRLSVTKDLKTDIFGGDSSVFFGFVGSTGGLSNLHQVCFNRISFVDNFNIADTSICLGESVQLDATIPSGVNYSWSPTTGISNPSISNPEFSPNTTTTYTVTINDVCGDSVTEDVLITVNTTPVVVDTPGDAIRCDSYTLPTLTNGNYYTATNGGGTPYFAGQTISTTTTLYVYADTGTTPNCKKEHPFTVTINATPTVDTPTDVTSCDSYTLPALTNGNYFTSSNGGGTQLSAGQTISTTTTLFVYAESPLDSSCYDQWSFTITINLTPVIDRPTDVSFCDSYTLPVLTNGNYFTAPNGGGTQLSAGSVISSSTTLFVYAETGTTPNCWDESKFNITIIPTPTIDTPNDVFSCESYTLPALTNGNYFTLPNGQGTLLNAGDILTATTPLYVYAESSLDPSCNNEWPFTITIHPSLISVLSLDVEVISEDFEDNQTIVASATGGNGDYEYQLDGGSWQNSGVFENVFGCETHTVRAREVLGCSTVPQKNINLVYFPKFFTPNNDGYNDTWNIKCLKDDPTAVISIFDRYGKLLKEFKPSRSAWNGAFNGSMLTATDYWFVVKYTNANGVEAKYRSHFSLRH
jgi:gliding motility-associated-like protein